jgi:tetratricopeptide (TPR) repeat protein
VTEALQLEIRSLRALLDSERDPKGRAFAPLADAYRRAGKVPEALRILREGIAKHPDFVTGHVVAAQLYVEQGLSAEGAIAARRALELDGENVSALKSLLRALDESGGTQEAEGVRSLLATLEPDFAPDWSVASAAPDATEDTEAAVVTELQVATEVAAEPEIPIEPEIAAPLALTGVIDLGKIGPTPTADLPLSALSPEPEPIELPSLDLGGEAEPVLDLPLIAPSFPETPEAEPVTDLAALAPESRVVAKGEDAVFDLATLTPSLDEVAAAEPVMDLPLLAPSSHEIAEDDETVMDLAMLAPDVADEPVMDLAMLAPSSHEIADDEPVMDVALLAPEPEADEPVMDLALLAPSSHEIAEDDETVMDLAMLAPSSHEIVADEPVMDLALLAPEPEADETVMDLAMLAPDVDDEPVMDLALLAPSSHEIAEDEPVMDLALLAPSSHEIADDEPVMDLALLAPEPEADEPVMDLALLAPEPEADEPVMDLAMLAPSSHEIAEDEPVFDLTELAPTPPPALPTGAEPALSRAAPAALVPDDESVFDLDTLAPKGEESAPAAMGTGNGQMAVEDAVEVGFLSPEEPNEVVIDLDALRPESVAETATSSPSGGAPGGVPPAAALETPSTPAAAPALPGAGEPPTDEAHEDSDAQAEPAAGIYTRTLAELYAAQGATKEAVAVLRHLLNEKPQDAELTRRIDELEAGGASATKERAQARTEEHEDEVETLARDLAQRGGLARDVDSPFAWTEREASESAGIEGPTIREYFDGLLGWEPREGA